MTNETENKICECGHDDGSHRELTGECHGRMGNDKVIDFKCSCKKFTPQSPQTKHQPKAERMTTQDDKTADTQSLSEEERKRKKEYKKDYQKNNLSKFAGYTQKWASKNKDKIRDKARRRYENPEEKKKLLIRMKTTYSNEKTGVCNDCKNKGKTEFHHLSYEPNIFIEVCKRCHNKRHGRELYV